MEDYATFIAQESYGSVGLVAITVGFLLAMYFFIYQMTYKTKDRSLNVELSLALLASTFCSIGLFTLALSVGMYF